MDFDLEAKNPPFPFLNRELSWLQFNERVLEEAEDKKTPLLEKLKFLEIYSENLDEFFMIRVAGVMKKVKHGQVFSETPDKIDLKTLLLRIRKKTLALQKRHEKCFGSLIHHWLRKHKIFILSYKELSIEEKTYLDTYFRESVYPALTPLNIDVSHPFPFLANLVNYLLVEFENDNLSSPNEDYPIGLIQIPPLLDRLIHVPSGQGKGETIFLLLEDLVKEYAEDLFKKRIKEKMFIRVTRNFEYTLENSRVSNLKDSVAEKIISRQNQNVVRLQHTKDAPFYLVKKLCEKLKLKKCQIYSYTQPYDYKGMKEVFKLPFPDLKFPKFNPRIPSRLALSDNIFQCIAEEDLLVHHPYESFYTIGEFIQTAAKDPKTVAIKQTLYRSSGDSPIIESLMQAARNGKDVTVVIELTARFDEQNNIDWSRRLENSGVKVVYGFVGLKTHCKLSLVLRKEEGKLAFYSHLSTGNYNPETAKLYTDLGLLTKNEEIGQDISKVFNILTGLNGTIFRNNKPLLKAQIPDFKHIFLSPFSMREKLTALIQKTKEKNESNAPRIIIIKVNALVDQFIIKELYEASNSGVKIHLIVRGSCSLKPGIEGFSKNISVTSIVDRFLEHSRIFYFKGPHVDQLLLGSADLMERNLNVRIEVLFPILEDSIKHRVITEILQTYMQDNVKARSLLSDGRYILPLEKNMNLQAQIRFIQLARSDGFKSKPYQEAIYQYLGKKQKRPLLFE
jgi:polyphosphate kinase